MMISRQTLTTVFLNKDMYIRLDKEINTNWLLKQLQHQINEHKKSYKLEDSVLCIEIKYISQTQELLKETKQLALTYTDTTDIIP
jgi:hypothetical protein